MCVFGAFIFTIMWVTIMNVSSLSRYNFLITFTKGLTVFFHLTMQIPTNSTQVAFRFLTVIPAVECLVNRLVTISGSSSSFRGVQLNFKIGPRKLEFLITLSNVTASFLEAKLIYTCLCSATPFIWTLK